MQFIVALTGASGHPYALRLLQKLAQAQADIALVLSEPACVALAAETGIKLNANAPDLKKLLDDDPAVLSRVRYFSPRDIAAPMASGSNRHDGMVIIPCSMGTLGRIAHGTSDDLITRAADVTLKERRKLILVTREMPLSLIHLKNMLAVTEAGATVMHACPHFYHRPQNVEEVVDTVVDRVLDQLGVPHQTKRWKADESHE
ncbi:MAG: UbiX family flavin prenyltransferase [Armatimonadota bacterium]|nr:UbiX family flavin prenyltransferase [Armatimonadota bacterium]